MNRFRYRIYCEHKEPVSLRARDRNVNEPGAFPVYASAPSAEGRSVRPIVTSMSLVRFPSMLRRHLPRDATVSSQPIVGDRNSIYVVVETVISEESTDQAVADCLKGRGTLLDLSVEKLAGG